MTRLQQHHHSSTQYASILACVLSCFLLLFCLSTPAIADVRGDDIIIDGTVDERGLSTGACPNIEANRAILVDGDGNVLFERSADEACKVASITKIMTALTAFAIDPELSTTVVIGEEAAAIGESSALLLEGDSMDMQTALTAMLVASGNDASQGIAQALGAKLLAEEGTPSSSEQECVARFVREMNAQAAALGLQNSVFTNPHGLDDEEYAGDLHATARDVAIEVAAAMQNEEFARIVSQPSTTISVRRDGALVPIELESTNILLESYEGTLGVKTGTTNAAGACFAGASTDTKHTLYSVVLDSSDEYQRFLDTQALWDWGYEHWKNVQLINTNERIAQGDDPNTTVPVVAHITHADWLDRSVPCTVADAQANADLFDLRGNITQSIECEPAAGNIRAGDVLGKLVFTQHGQTIAELDLLAATDAPAPNIIEGIGIWWQRLWGNSDLAQTTLENQVPLLVDKSLSSGM